MHRTKEEFEELLSTITAAPNDLGPVELIVARPRVGHRVVIESGTLTKEEGLVGDNWLSRGSTSTRDGSANPQAQLTLMGSRVADAVAVSKERWPLAGDQIYVDMDLSVDNLPAGTRLALGNAILQISASPHAGCAKFSERFGPAALRFVNVGVGKELRLRGVNAQVMRGGSFAVGDKLTKLVG